MGKVGIAHPALSMPKSSELLAPTITAAGDRLKVKLISQIS